MLEYQTILKYAVQINKLCQDYDPYDFEPEIYPPEEIATMIINQDDTVLTDLMEIASNCINSGDYGLAVKATGLLSKTLKFYQTAI